MTDEPDLFGHLAPASGADTGEPDLFGHLMPADDGGKPPTSSETPETWMQWAEGVAQEAAKGVTSNWGDEIAAGMGAGTNWAARKLGVPNTPERSYQTILDEVRGRGKEFERRNPGTALTAEIAGSLGQGVPGARFITRGVGLGARALRAGVVGAGTGAIQATGDLENPDGLGDYAKAAAKGAGTGAMIGAGLNAAGSAAGSVLAPWASPAALRLTQRGIPLTPGELVGGNAKRMEDTLTSIPIVNRFVRARQQEGIDAFNLDRAQNAIGDLNNGVGTRLQQPGTQLPANLAPGNEAIDYAHQQVQRAFQMSVPRLRARIDAPLRQEIARARAQVPVDRQNAFDNFVDTHLKLTSNPSGDLRGADVQDAIQGLRDTATDLITSPGNTTYDRILGRQLRRVRQALESNAETRSDPSVVTKFRNANAGFARLVRLEKAATSNGATNQVITPAMYANAVKVSDRSARKSAVARGQALEQGIANDAKSVMTRQISDSGTPERSMVAGVIGGATLALPKASIAALGGLSSLYTRAGNRAFQRLATFSPRTRATIERLTRQGLAASTPAAVDYGRQ